MISKNENKTEFLLHMCLTIKDQLRQIKTETKSTYLNFRKTKLTCFEIFFLNIMHLLSMGSN